VNDLDESVVADQFLSQYSVHRLRVDHRIFAYHLHTSRQTPCSRLDFQMWRLRVIQMGSKPCLYFLLVNYTLPVQSL